MNMVFYSLKIKKTNKKENKMDKQKDKYIYIEINDNNTRWKNYLSLLKDSGYITK